MILIISHPKYTVSVVTGCCFDIYIERKRMSRRALAVYRRYGLIIVVNNMSDALSNLKHTSPHQSQYIYIHEHIRRDVE